MKNMQSKKALIVTPYLDHLGGGERYMLEAASAIESAGYALHFAWDNLRQITKLAPQLNINLNDPQLDPHVLPHYASHNPLSMYSATHQYDLVLYLSDGSIPLLGAKFNLIHIQVPFQNVGGTKLTTQLKLKKVNNIIVNSEFTKSFIDQEFRVNSQVIYPPITPIRSGKKENIILAVGRFEPSINIKKQDLLIQAFREIQPELAGWRLALAGGSSDANWLKKLQDSATGLPIDFYPNLTYSELTDLYGKAKIFWHAAGYQVDVKEHPELAEHFGITTAEAITAGCIPLVVPKGGQTEVVPDSQYHWTTLNELRAHSLLAASGKLSVPSLPPTLSLTNFQNALSEFI